PAPGTSRSCFTSKGVDPLTRPRTSRGCAPEVGLNGDYRMRLFLRISALLAPLLLSAWALPGCSSDEGGGKMGTGAMTDGKMDGGAMAGGKMEAGAMDKGKMDGGKMGGAMDKGKMDGGKMEETSK